MKVSVKLREDQHPLLRAKLPLDLIRNLPLFAGVSVGSSQEFALHVGSSLQEGLSGRVSYRPNDAHHPFALTLKSTFDPRVVVCSSTKAVFSVAAEFSVSRRGCPSFRLWVKPRFGDYSLSKCQDFGCRSGNHEFEGGLVDLKEVSEGGRTLKLDQRHSFSCPVSLQDGCATSVPVQRQLMVANGVDAIPFRSREQHQPWSFRYADNGTRISLPSFSPETNLQEGSDLMHNQEQRATLNCCESASHGSGLNLAFPRQNEGRQLGFSGCPNIFCHQSFAGIPRSGLRKGCSGWSLRAHTALPLSRQIVARIRWTVDLPSDLLESLESGGPFSFLKLPMLSMDKVTVEGMDPLKMPRKPMCNTDASEDVGFKNPYWRMPEKNPESEHFAATCSEMKQQLHFLHSENKVLMKSMNDLRTELNSRGVREFDAIKMPAKDYSTEDENLLYLHLFGEILAKCDKTSKGMYLGNVRRLKNKEDFIETDKWGVTMDGGTSDDHPSDVSQDLKKAIVKVNDGNFRRN